MDLIARMDMKRLRCCNHQRGRVANAVHLPPTESKEPHLVWHLQPERERVRERSEMRHTDGHFISVISFIHLSLWPICSLQDCEKGCYSGAGRWAVYFIHPATNSLFPFLYWLPRLIFVALFYPSSLTRRWHLKWRWQEAPPCTDFWVTLCCG